MSEVIKLPPSLLNSAEGQQTLTVRDCTAAATSADHTRTQNHVFYLSQAKYWNPSVNEVEGVITDRKGNVIHKLFGKWHEAVYCGKPPSATCVWRASTTVFFINASMQSLCSMVRLLSRLSVPCRGNASGPWAALRFYQVCYWAERAGPVPETSAPTHRYPAAFGPKVGQNTKGAINAAFNYKARILTLSHFIFDLNSLTP